MQLKIKDTDILRILNVLNLRNTRIRELIAFFETLFDRIDKHHLFLVAAGIAFNILLYLIPLMLVIIFAISSFYEVGQITVFLSHFLNDVLPPGEQSKQLLVTTITEVTTIFSKSGTAGIIGIGTLLWLSSILLGSIRTGLNSIFHLQSNRMFLVYKLKDIVLTLMLSVMVLVTIYLLPMLSIVSSSLHSIIPEFIAPYFSKAYLMSVSLSISFLMFYMLYRFVPNQKINRSVRMLSTILCVVFIEISRYAFAYYISGVSSYGKFYGTYAIIASMSVWLYYLTMIILLSAELSQLIYEVFSYKNKQKRIDKNIALHNAEE